PAGPLLASAPAGAPVRVRIPAIEVDAPLDRLGLDAAGALQVPPYDRAGWYEGGPEPGEVGRAVIAAHVDSTTGPAVFYRLRTLEPGDAVIVDYDTGMSVSFVVGATETYPKSQFPTERVYGPTDAPSLALITCAGSFDRRSRSYEDNLVVFASAQPV
ncbi:MAG: class F sortase, partial [Actinomycetota bacterium]|nr:class F sortase [Actinomycetota bacterium]